VIGKRYGLDPEAMVDVLNESTGGSWITQNHYHQRVFNRAFSDPFKLALMLKDVGIALQLAKRHVVADAHGRPGPAAVAHGRPRRRPRASVSELVRWFEQLSGTAITPGAGPRQAAG
jgi:3-hydroxyisobutyrate dehydrogenase